MTKTLFIVPGFTESVSDPQYQRIANLYKSKGYSVMGVNIAWKRKVMSDYVQEFSEYFQKHATEENYIFGFSFGAMIALISAPALKPNGIILCSLSPYFKEDLRHVKNWWKEEIGKNRIRDFKKYSAVNIAKEITTNAKIYYGSAEGEKFPQLKVRCEETAKAIQEAELIVIKDAPHNLGHSAYIEALERFG